MIRLLRPVAVLGVAVGLSATALGLVAPWIPYLDLINHFRPYMLVGATALSGLAWFCGTWRLRGFAAVFFALTTLLFLLPLVYGASDATGRQPFLRVITFNLWGSQARPDDTISFLRGENADVILLQEAESASRIVAGLRDTYPYVGACPDDRCEVRLLAKRPFSETGRHARTDQNPPVIWARFIEEGITYEVFGVHMAYPFDPRAQQAHVEWLSAVLASRGHSFILAGDLNLTPFSWKLAKLTVSAGMRRHGTFLMSFPAHEWAPYVLLDNVLSTPDFGTVAVRTGPRLGSDHLPVVADIAHLATGSIR